MKKITKRTLSKLSQSMIKGGNDGDVSGHHKKCKKTVNISQPDIDAPCVG